MEYNIHALRNHPNNLIEISLYKTIVGQEEDLLVQIICTGVQK